MDGAETESLCHTLACQGAVLEHQGNLRCELMDTTRNMETRITKLTSRPAVPFAALSAHSSGPSPHGFAM